MFLLFTPVAASAPLPADDPPLAWVALSAPSGIAGSPSIIQTSNSALLPNTGLQSEPAPRMTALGVDLPVSKSTDPIEAMVAYAFPEAPIMVEIAKCESGNRTPENVCIGPLNPHADNPKSSAYGVFQILEGTWIDHDCTGDRGNPRDNIRCARAIYERSGTSPWNDSHSAWGS